MNATSFRTLIPGLPFSAAVAIALTALLIMVCSARAQTGRPEPRVGYLHPAGACRGTTVTILAGGQALQGVDTVRVSGSGVSARVIKTYRPVRNLDGDQRRLLQWRIACRRAELEGQPKPAAPKPPPANPDGSPAPEITLPEMPLLDLLGRLDARAITHWTTEMQRLDRAQQNNQLGELVRVEVKVAANAIPGMREFRFGGPRGFTNPLRFEVSQLPEIREIEPNEAQAQQTGDALPAAVTPCIFNGRIQAGDVDVFRFRAKRGANLVVIGKARALIPYLADAVPGWFEMVLTVRDASGREIAYGDSFRFDPDPAFRFRVPEDGEYTLEVRDSIHRGREDFIYRVHVGELPFISSVFPPGGTEGVAVNATLRGWNLPVANLPLDTSAGGPVVRSRRLFAKRAPSNEIHYVVDRVPDLVSREPNDDAEHAQAIGFPAVVNGTIDPPGDVDIYRIEGRMGTELAVEILARRLRSPLDAVIHVADETGTILAWNDDLMEKDGHLHLGDGLLTHHADPRLRVRLPADGPVFIRVADTQGQGGPDHVYRLRVGPVRPDFELRVTPSAVNAPAGGHVPVMVHALRADGFDGEILLSLENAPQGYHLTGGRIPPGVSRIPVTLFVPRETNPGLLFPVISGSASDSGETVTREARPADDTMQAFLWRHLVPAEEWLVHTAPGLGRRPPFELATRTPVRLAAGATTDVRVTTQPWILDRKPEPELSDAPAGITVSAARPFAGGIAFDLCADAGVSPSLETNLIIHLFATAQPGASASARNRSPLGGLPAIPILITPPASP